MLFHWLNISVILNIWVAVLCLLIWNCQAISGGKEYIVILFEHEYLNSISTDTAQISVINHETIGGTVSIDNNRDNAINRNYELGAKGVVNIDLNTSKLLAATTTFNANSEKVAIDIKSDVFISVVARNKMTNAADAYLAIPLTYAADDYYVISFCISFHPLCHVGVVPVTEGYTKITYDFPNKFITLSASNINGVSTFNGGSVSSTFSFRYVHVIRSADDMNGLRITSDKPINVFVGNDKGEFLSGNSGQLDFLEEQVPATTTWGVSFFVYSHNVNEDALTIIASTENTMVRILTQSSLCYEYLLAKGGDVYFNTLEDLNYIVAESPIAVTHFVSNGGRYAMYFVTPIEQYVNEAVFYFPSTNFNTYTNTLTVYTHWSKTMDIQLDGLPIDVTWLDSKYGDMSVATISLLPDIIYTLTFLNDGTFGGYIHGFDNDETYAHVLSVNRLDLLTGCYGSVCYNTSAYDTNICPRSTTSTTTTTIVPTTTSTTTTAPTTTSTTTTVPTTTSTTTTATSTTTTRPPTTATSKIQFTTRVIPSVPYADHFITTPSPTTTPLSTTTTTPTTPTNIISTCQCPCADVATNYIKHSSVSANSTTKFEELIEELTIKPEETSAHRRLFTSAEDDRVSSKSLGYLSAVGFICIFVGVIAADVGVFVKDSFVCCKSIRIGMKAISKHGLCPVQTKPTSIITSGVEFEAEIDGPPREETLYDETVAETPPNIFEPVGVNNHMAEGTRVVVNEATNSPVNASVYNGKPPTNTEISVESIDGQNESVITFYL